MAQKNLRLVFCIETNTLLCYTEFIKIWLYTKGDVPMPVVKVELVGKQDAAMKKELMEAIN